MVKSILIIGATGKQGSAAIDALLNCEEAASFSVLGLTRNASSPSAQKLAERGVKLVQGDLSDVPAVFKTAQEVAGEPIWGIFVVLVVRGTTGEEAQGKALVDGAIVNGIKHFVYSSVDRGGDSKSWENPTNIPHFISKHHIELYLREKAEDKMMWSILRPTAFMENWCPGFYGQVSTTTWRLRNPTKPLQLISTRDIGIFASICFMDPKSWNHKALGLAGSEISFAEANAIFKEKTGLPQMPETYEFVVKGLLWAVKEMSIMFDWFATDGYGADISALKKINLDLMSWSEWLGKDSGWVKK